MRPSLVRKRVRQSKEMATKIVPLGLLRTPLGVQLPPPVVVQEEIHENPPIHHTANETDTVELNPVPGEITQVYDQEEDFSSAISSAAFTIRGSGRNEMRYASPRDEEDDDLAFVTALLDNLPCPEDEILHRESARITRQMFSTKFPELEEYISKHKIDDIANNVGLLVRHVILGTLPIQRVLEIVPVLHTSQQSISGATGFAKETDDMFLSPKGLRPRSTHNPLDDIWDARVLLTKFVATASLPNEDYLTAWDRAAMRIRSGNLWRGLLNHLQSGGTLTDTANLRHLARADATKLVELSGYREMPPDEALYKKKTSANDILEHLSMDSAVLFETFPVFSYHCMLLSQRRPPSKDSYVRLVEIVLHTHRIPINRVVRDLCTSPDNVFWIHILKRCCDTVPVLWAVLGHYTPALAALVGFVGKTWVEDGVHYDTSDVTRCIADILGVLVEVQDDDDTFTSVSQKIRPPRWSEVFANYVSGRK